MTDKSGLKEIAFTDTNDRFSVRIKKDIGANNDWAKVQKKLNELLGNRKEWLIAYHQYLK